MEDKNISYHAIKKGDLSEVWLHGCSQKEKLASVVNYVAEKIGADDISERSMKLLEEKTRLFCKSLTTKYAKYGRKFGKNSDKFRFNNSVWLTDEVKFDIKMSPAKSKSSTVGRPKSQFWNKSEFGKRKEAAELSESVNNETNLLVRAAATSARKGGNVDMAAVLNLVSPTRPSIEFPLKSEQFQTFCFATAELIQKLYPWWPMTSTLHKVLIHSKEIIDNTVLPLGFFGETAAESRNKIYKSRTNNRINNLRDIFNRAADTSDPLISTKYLGRRIQKQKSLQLAPEVVEMISSFDSTQERIENDARDE